MHGQIALVGGDEFRRGCEEMDREIIRAAGQEPAKILVIPTAAVTGPAKAANDGTTYFGALGGDSDKLMLLERRQAEDQIFFAPAILADVVYFTGGSPEYLLDTVKHTEFFSALMEFVDAGGVLAGSSAGAMAMGSMMRRPKAGGWVESLGVVADVVVLPHHEKSDQSETSKDLRASAPTGLTFLGIDARTGVLGIPDNWRVVGSGRVTVYQGSEWQIFNTGDALPTGF